MTIETKATKRSAWFTPAQSAAYYGRPRTLEEVVLHHWNTPAQRPSFAGVVQYLTQPPKDVPSANTIIGYDEKAKRVRILDTVPYPNVAFTSSGAAKSPDNKRRLYINAVSVGIEIDPLIEVKGHAQRGALIKAVGYRVFKYWLTAKKKLPVRGHNTYAATSCPGAMPFTEIVAEANRLWAAHHAPKPTPKPTPAPTPKPSAKPPAVTYRGLNKAIMVTIKNPTKVWDFNVSDWADFKAVKDLPVNSQVTVYGKAVHPLGGTYLMTEHSLGTTDHDKINAAGFKPKHTTGINIKDLKTYVAPAPQPTPVPTPAPAPTPPPAPTPTPVEPQPSDYDKKQDLEITAIKGTLNSLKALLIEFAQSILSKLNKG